MRTLAIILLLLFPWTSEAADIWVTTLIDDLDESNGTCNLREAIKASNLDTDVDACEADIFSDTIYFSVTGVLGLDEALPEITDDINIVGPGRTLLIINGGFYDSVLRFNMTDLNHSVSGLTLYGGSAQLGGGIWARGTPGGGTGTLRVKDSNILDNFSTSSGAGIYVLSAGLILDRVNISGNNSGSNGGGIYLNSSQGLTLRDSSVSGNTSSSSGGGLRVFTGPLIITRSTISSNTAGGFAGGVYYVGSGGVDISHSSISFNQADIDELDNESAGLHLYCQSSNSEIVLLNNIIAQNTDQATGRERDLSNEVFSGCAGQIIDSTSNLIGAAEYESVNWPLGEPNINGDFVGYIFDPLVIDVEPLGFYGRITEHHPLKETSLNLLDRGLCPDEVRDQVGRTSDPALPDRAVDTAGVPNTFDGCDIGPVEHSVWNHRQNVEARAFLDGAYVGDSMMNSDLAATGELPDRNPYDVGPWNHIGNEFFAPVPSDMTDWVLMRIWKGGRQDAGGLVLVDTRAFGLATGGLTINPSGSGHFNFEPGNYYVSIEHRNHLGVISSVPVSISWDKGSNYNFTFAQNSAFSAGGQPLRQRASFTHSMWAGDGSADGSVSAFDFLNVWLPANGTGAGYHAADFDLSSDVTAFDFLNAWLSGNGQARQY